MILVVTRMVTRGNENLNLERKQVAHAYTLIELIRMANFQFENEVIYMLALSLNLHSILKYKNLDL